MRVSNQTPESIFKSRSLFTNSMWLVLVALLWPAGNELSAAQDSIQQAEFESVPQHSEISAAANSAVSLEFPSESPAQVELATESDSEPLPQPPSAPQSILVPKTPSADTFTETNSDGGIGSDSVRLPGDGSQAIGTFATQNPFVRQPGQSGQSTMPPGSPAMQSGIPPISHNGLRGASSGMTNRITTAQDVPPSAAPSSNSSFGSPQKSTFGDQSRRSFGNRLPVQNSQNVLQPTFENQTRQSFGDQTSNTVSDSSQLSGQNSIPPIQTAPQQFGDSSSRPSAPVGFNALPVDRSTPVDNQVRPTGFNQITNRSRNPNELARQLLGRYEVGNAPSPLPGRPTSLLEMLRQPIPVSQRRTMVSQYWETYYDWATFLSRAEHLSWLNSIASPSSPADQALLRAAKSAAGNHVLAAEIQLGKSQSRLTDFLPNRSDLLPLPSDKPLVQKYKTNYELYRQHGMIPTRLRGIDEMLPKTLRLIQNRAETVQLAKTAADNGKQALTSRQSSLATVLEAARIWRAAEQDLVATVTNYNKAIADYSLTIARSNQSPEQIVGMLIAKPKAKTSLNSYPRTAQGPRTTQQPRNSASQYAPPSLPSQSGSRSIGQQGNGNFGPTPGRGGVSQSIGQPISRPAGGQQFGSGRPISRSTNNAVAPPTASGSSFGGSPIGQGFGGAQNRAPSRTANSQSNQFGQ